MELAFRTKALRTLCLSGELMNERLGPERAERLRMCLADMRAAEHLAEVPLVEVRHSSRALDGELILDLGDELQLTLKASSLKPPVLPSGVVDWEKLDRVIIQRVHAPHG